MTSKVDLSEFFKYSRPKKPPCKVGFAAAQAKLSETDHAALTAACETDNNIITNAAIIEWFSQRGQKDLNASSVTSHRKRTCSCYEQS